MASARTTREGERRLSLGTLTIASLASAAAAVVVSTFWRSGTPIAAAVTPVIVALVSEMLHRPTAVIAGKLTSEADALPLSARISRLAGGEPEPTHARSVERPAGREGDLPSRVPREDLPSRAPPEARPGPRPAGEGEDEMRVYSGARHAGPARSGPRPASSLPWKAIAVTAAIACAIGVTVLTVTELLAGESLGRGGGHTTLLGGGKKKQESTDSQDRTTPEEQDTTSQPQQAPPQQTQPTTPQPKDAPKSDQQQKKSGQTTTPTTPTTPTTRTTPKAPSPKSP